jgi:hypothetical protein
VELVKCSGVVSGKGSHQTVTQRCTTELTSSDASIAGTGASLTAVLSRGATVFAKGLLIGTRKRSRLLLSPRRRIAGGRYTLTLSSGHEHERETITIV